MESARRKVYLRIFLQDKSQSPDERRRQRKSRRVLAVFQRWLIAQAQLVPSGSATMMAMRILLKRVVNDQAFPLEADRRECHIGGDFLLIYRLDGEAIVFVRAGTHSELCEE